MAVQMILGLTILVGVHEWGHFFAARLFKIKVSKFYLFFDFLFPLPHVLNFALFKFKKGDTEYGLGWFPFGGYVKIEGMIDESMDKDQMAQPPQPWEFRSKPAWQRLIVMLGGIIVNVIVGVLIFISVTKYTGRNYIPIENVKHGIYAGELAQEIGLQTGDKIIKVNGEAITEFDEVYNSDVFLGDNASYTVLREGNEIQIDIPSDFMNKLSEMTGRNSFVSMLNTFKVGEVQPGSNAANDGLLKGDSIIKIGRKKVRFFEEFSVDKMDYAGKVVPLKIIRNGEPKTLNMHVGEDGRLGFYADIKSVFEHKDLSFLESVGIGTTKAFTFIYDNIKGFGKIFSGDIAPDKAVQGPIGIAKMFGGSFDWLRFWTLCGSLSMILAFMNLLPIPALDGGHAVMLTYEIITGKKPSDKFLEYAQMVGMVILLSLMVFAIFNDIIKF